MSPIAKSLLARKLPLSRRRFFGVAAATAALGITDAVALEPGWLKTRRVRLHPAGNSPAHRLVHFTDVHHKGDRAWLAQVVARINALAPDFVCFTGDLVEEHSFVPEALQILRGLKAPLYGVPGNHDYWADADFDQIAETFRATGGQWLLDAQATTADGRVNLIGATCTKAPEVAPRAGVKNILLIHYPAWIEKARPHKFDLALAGHSHGGQVRLPFIGSVVVPGGVDKYDLGLFRTDAGPLYVGAGIGYFYANVRFNCRPEITLIEL